MNVMRKRLVELLRDEFGSVVETFGYLTKFTRERLGLSKSHCVDAFVISHNLDAETLDVEFRFRKVRRHNRQLHISNLSRRMELV